MGDINPPIMLKAFARVNLTDETILAQVFVLNSKKTLY
ncbi:hypothetical protein PALB_32460 [Pseudoalteromonas luteoviolacea B = ATCC 29581]|nr:hypothetical protein PALB_32460 [Pseudoalteromonas luteoviolacea B = ATCC 29581]